LKSCIVYLENYNKDINNVLEFNKLAFGENASAFVNLEISSTYKNNLKTVIYRNLLQISRDNNYLIINRVLNLYFLIYYNEDPRIRERQINIFEDIKEDFLDLIKELFDVLISTLQYSEDYNHDYSANDSLIVAVDFILILKSTKNKEILEKLNYSSYGNFKISLKQRINLMINRISKTLGRLANYIFLINSTKVLEKITSEYNGTNIKEMQESYLSKIIITWKSKLKKLEEDKIIDFIKSNSERQSKYFLPFELRKRVQKEVLEICNKNNPNPDSVKNNREIEESISKLFTKRV